MVQNDFRGSYNAFTVHVNKLPNSRVLFENRCSTTMTLNRWISTKNDVSFEPYLGQCLHIESENILKELQTVIFFEWWITVDWPFRWLMGWAIITAKKLEFYEIFPNKIKIIGWFCTSENKNALNRHHRFFITYQTAPAFKN